MSTIQNNSSLFINIEDKENNPKSISLLKETVGLAAGAGAGFFVKNGANSALINYNRKLLSSIDKFHSFNSGVMLQEAEKMATEADLYQKGFKGIRIVDASSEEKLKQSIKEVSEETIKSINNMSVMKKLTLRSIVLLNKLSDISYLLIGTIPDLKLKIQSGIKYGGYNPSFNYVISGRTGSLLHEIGHAINKNKNFFTRIPLRLKIVSSLVLTPLAILTAMFHKKENNNPENKTFLTKTKDFVKERIGLTIAVLSLLSLVEEVLASLRAFKFTEKSKLMTEAIKKEHNKILLMAFGTYVADAAILTGMAKTAVWVKNKVTGDK